MAIVKVGTPVLLTMSKSSASHFNYEHIDMESIRVWHEKFFSKQRDVNGIFTTDFLMNEDNGKIYPIETNPRLGSLFSLFLSVDANKIVDDCILKEIDMNKN